MKRKGPYIDKRDVREEDYLFWIDKKKTEAKNKRKDKCMGKQEEDSWKEDEKKHGKNMRRFVQETRKIQCMER